MHNFAHTGNRGVVNLKVGLRAALLLLTGSVCGAQNLAESPKFETIRLSDSLYTFRYEGSRNIFIVSKDGVIATDPISPEAAKVYRDEIAKVTDQPVRYVVYSHQHWDHILGGRIFKDEGATFISHQNCVNHFFRRSHPDLVLPDQVIQSNHTLQLGDQSIELLYFGENHGDCLLVMHMPNERMIFLVDLVTPGFIGLGNLPDYDPGEYLRSLQDIEALDFDEMIGGHGPPRAPKGAITERRRWLETIMTAVKKELDAGTPREEIAGRLDFPEFKHLAGYDSQLHDFVDRMLRYYEMGW